MNRRWLDRSFADPKSGACQWPRLNAMNIVVCVKQIPDPAAPQSFDAQHNLNRTGKLILDEADTFGVEMALQLVDKAGDGEVTVVSMGAAADVGGIRNALAMGAAKAVIVSDESLRGTDALGTAKVLAAVIKRISPDLVLAATESSDGYTGTTPVQIAELLGLPSITFAKSVSIDGTTVKVERQTDSGYDEVTVPLPALVTVTAGVVEPRYASFKGIMAAKSKPLEVLSVADLSLGAETGQAGAREEITDIVAAESRASGEKYVDEGDGAEKIVAFLESIKVL
jgi:electron transfer flavoprotein beta subunit